MERYFRISLSFFMITFVAAVVTFSGCSSDDNPADPNPPVDTTGNNDTNTTTIDDKVRTVVFVHGFMEASDVYTQMTQLFAANGYDEAQLQVFDLENYFTGTTANVQAMAAQLASKIDAVLQTISDDRVDIVAHGIGVNAVQEYLVNNGGTDKLAHIVFAGGSYDLTLAVQGDITPAPCAYMTIRSNGLDDLQNGDASYGEIAGAEHVVGTGLDNIQLVTDPAMFEEVFEFFTGTEAQATSIPNSIPGETYTIKGRVIDFIDNTPISGIYVTPITIRTLSNGEIQRQTGTQTLETDADGYFTYTVTFGPEQHTEFLLRSVTGSHFDMHVYCRPWRADAHTVRLRMAPRSASGSQLLREFSSSLRTGDHSNFFVHSLNQAMQFNDDALSITRYNPAFEQIGEVSLLTAGNAPAAGVSSVAGNTFIVAVLDYDGNQADGTGPIATSGLNMFGLNSFDAYLAGKPANHQTQVTFNGQTIGMQNFASNGGLGANNGGFSMAIFGY
ncbi:MAG: hypothetical protein C0600_10245 [Ignavibacteria bacterium]|nr:MAG: hypothetical protein C0600_10245 [Ignavibacteria bacterium]